MRKNKSNKKIIKYKTFKFTNKSIRKFAPNPTKPLHSFGLIGKIFSCFLNFFLKPIIHYLDYFILKEKILHIKAVFYIQFFILW